MRKECQEDEEKRERKTCEVLMPLLQLQYNDTSHFKDIDNPIVLITVTYN